MQLITELHKAIMHRDSVPFAEADELVQEARAEVHTYGVSPEEVLYEMGFEPDYFFDLLDF